MYGKEWKMFIFLCYEYERFMLLFVVECNHELLHLPASSGEFHYASYLCWIYDGCLILEN